MTHKWYVKIRDKKIVFHFWNTFLWKKKNRQAKQTNKPKSDHTHKAQFTNKMLFPPAPLHRLRSFTETQEMEAKTNFPQTFGWKLPFKNYFKNSATVCAAGHSGSDASWTVPPCTSSSEGYTFTSPLVAHCFVFFNFLFVCFLSTPRDSSPKPWQVLNVSSTSS